MADAVKKVAHVFENAWDHAAHNKPVDPRVAPGISVPGHSVALAAPAAATVASAAPVAPVDTGNPPAPVSTSVVPPKAASVAAAGTSTPATAAGAVNQPTNLLERLKAAMGKGEHEIAAEVEKLLGDA